MNYTRTSSALYNLKTRTLIFYIEKLVHCNGRKDPTIAVDLNTQTENFIQ